MFVKIVLSLLVLYSINIISAEDQMISIVKLPPNVPSCRNEDIDIKECFKDAFDLFTTKSKEGAPEYGIEAFDPTVHDKFKFSFSNGIIRCKAILRNITVSGFSKCTVYRPDNIANETMMVINLNMKCPNLEITSIYRGVIQINNAKFSAKGDFNMSITDFDTRGEHWLELYERDNETYMRVKKIDYYPKVGNMVISAKGLIPEPELNDIFVEILNQNWRTLIDLAFPAVGNSLEPTAIKNANEILNRIPYKRIQKQ